MNTHSCVTATIIYSKAYSNFQYTVWAGSFLKFTYLTIFLFSQARTCKECAKLKEQPRRVVKTHFIYMEKLQVNLFKGQRLYCPCGIKKSAVNRTKLVTFLLQSSAISSHCNKIKYATESKPSVFP